MNMKETMQAEQQEAIETLQRANDLLFKMFGIAQEDEVSEWETRVNLTHAQQLDRYGWCVCEGTNGEGQLAEDCPREGEDDE